MKGKFFWTFLILGISFSARSSAANAETPTVSSATSMGATTPSVRFSSFSVLVSSSTREIHAIHLTAWAAGSPQYRRKLDVLLSTTVINALVIDIKEFKGEVYIPGVKVAEKARAYEAAAPDLADWIADLKKRGIYTIARVVVFKDNKMPRKNPTLAVHNVHGELWFDRTHNTWLDPYNEDAWRYNLLIALEASRMGFNEVQFDYIRFPTDGNLAQMRFLKPYSRRAASEALVGFLRRAAQLLHPFGTKISIDVFGLTTSVTTGMGIGQRLGPMAEQVDYVCPMVYPSHYYRGEYGIPNPNDQPYKTVHMALGDALKMLGAQGPQKLRPYLQDFSLKGRGIRYGEKEVRAQIQAAADLGILNWALWNAHCIYTVAALKVPPVPFPHPLTSRATDVPPGPLLPSENRH